jgi:hypothetical protein
VETLVPRELPEPAYFESGEMLMEGMNQQTSWSGEMLRAASARAAVGSNSSVLQYRSSAGG